MNIEQQRFAFEAWAKQNNLMTHRAPSNADLYEKGFTQDAWEAWQAALASPEVKALRDALQEVVAAADGEGWDQLDPGMEKQRAALAAMEKQK